MGIRNGKPTLREEDIAFLTKSSGLGRLQVKSAFKNFVQEYPDGKMSPEMFHEMMLKALPKEDATKMEENMFRLYDTDNSGFIEFTEFMVILLVFQGGDPKEVLMRIFRVFDVDGDGFITQKEMTKLTKDMYSMIKVVDPDVAPKEMLARFAFTEMDKDKDRKVSLDEFIEASMAEEKFSKMLTESVKSIFSS